MDNEKAQKRIIINRPEALGYFRRGTEWSLTTVGWIIWFFLCRPFMLIFLWFLGVQIFYEHMVRLSGLRGLREFFGAYLGVILLIFLILRVWNIYNYSKFRGKDRRQKAIDTSVPELEKFFKLDPGAINTLYNWSQIAIDFAPDHHQRLTDASLKDRAPINSHFHPSAQPPHPNPSKNGNGHKD